MANRRPLRFIELENGWQVCCSHKPNRDGYFRKRWADGAEMFHRFIYRIHHGEIPDGWEVDHLCGTRQCCNPKHLEAKPRTQHLTETNRSRYARRKQAARGHWETTRATGTELAETYGVSVSTACGWIRQWKREVHESST